MRSWTLANGDPLCLTFSADRRLAELNYGDDQTWALSLAGGEPPALAIETSFGLRARRMRYYLRFLRKDADFSDPGAFDQAPVVHLVYANYCRLEFWPFPGIEVQADYWVSASNTFAGRLRFKNHSILSDKFTFEWVGMLSPLEIGEGLFTAQKEGITLLNGKTGDLTLICAFKQKTRPGKGPLPALALDLDLAPGNVVELNWTAVACKEPDRCYEQVQAFLAHRWEASLARVMLQNESQLLEISTGDEELDAALAMTQNTAYRLFFPGNQHLPHSSFVLSRQPDYGYSRRGDGSDYPFLWDGQTALDAYYLAGLILPGGDGYAEGILRNFLATQLEDGSIDWKPSLAGKPSRKLAQPILACLAWQIYQSTGSDALLQDTYSGLLRFLRSWFSPRNDRDGDGCPEWDQAFQTGLEDNPLYDRWNPAGDGNDISTLECPGLASLLYREADSLHKIATRLNIQADLSWLESVSNNLRVQVEAAWNDQSGGYLYRDELTHQTAQGGGIQTLIGPGNYALRHRFKPAARLLFRIIRQNETTRAVSIQLTGQVGPGKTVHEEFTPRSWAWAGSTGSATTQNVYTSIGKIDAAGLEPEDQIQILRTDASREDISLLFPLWARIPTPERAKILVEETLVQRYLRPSGIPDYLSNERHPLRPSLYRATPLWNAFVGEGLLEYGYRSQAADLIERLIEASITSLRTNQAFYQYIHPETGLPLGERNHLHGLIPLGLFLRVAGIHQIGANFVILKDFNAFSYPVTVKYQGMMITCLNQKTQVSFPGGYMTEVTNPGLHRVSINRPGS
jgi:hypothetical protein